LAIDVYPKDKPIPPGEDWYYELDARVHGPLSRQDLEDLLNRSGDTALDVRVRHGANGTWAPFRSTSGANSSVRIAPADLLPAHDTAQSSGLSGLADVIRANWAIGAVGGAWLLLNAMFLAFWPHAYSTERRYLQTLRGIEAEVRELRSSSASDPQWQELSKRAKAVLAPIISDLKKSASPSEPARQQLLWAARDILPRTIGPRTKERDEQEQRLKQYLDTAERELGGP
jgi:hypothetical protein